MGSQLCGGHRLGAHGRALAGEQHAATGFPGVAAFHRRAAAGACAGSSVSASEPATGREALGPVPAAPVVQDELPVVASLSPFPRSDETSAPAPAESATPVLELVVSKDSWIQVRGADGRELLKAIVRAGERRAFSEGGPFSVNVGNVGGVSASVNGSPVDLARYARGNVARFDVTDTDGSWHVQGRSSEASVATRDEG